MPRVPSVGTADSKGASEADPLPRAEREQDRVKAAVAQGLAGCDEDDRHGGTGTGIKGQGQAAGMGGGLGWKGAPCFQSTAEAMQSN